MLKRRAGGSGIVSNRWWAYERAEGVGSDASWVMSFVRNERLVWRLDLMAKAWSCCRCWREVVLVDLGVTGVMAGDWGVTVGVMLIATEVVTIEG